MTDGSDAHTRWTRVFLAALVAVVAVHFVRLEMDAPYRIISQSGEFITDEGWYTKSAQLHAKFGVWTTEYDTVWFTHNALFTLLETAAFKALGVSLVVARLVSVLSFCTTIAAFYAILRTIQPRAIALGACLVAAVTLHTFAYSRLALAEPTGVAVSMLALAAWVRLPRGFAACAAGLVLAAAAYFVKLSFLFTLVALVMLALGEAVVLARSRERRAAAAVLAAAVAVPLATWVVQSWISGSAPDQAATFEKWHVTTRFNDVARGGVALHEVKAMLRILFQSGAFALAATVAVLGSLVAVRVKWRGLVPRTPAALALVLWGLGGLSFFGLFEYQPARYFYFAIFPLAFGAVAVIGRLVAPARWAAAVAALLAVHAAVQAPGYAEWLSRGDLMSGDRTAREVVAHMNLGDSRGPVGIIGGSSSFVALYDDRLLPVDYRFEDWLPERVGKWRPRFLFTPPTSAFHLAANCPDLVDRVEFVASWRFMDNYYTLEDHALYRIVYKP